MKKKIISILILLIIIVFFVYYIMKNMHDFKNLKIFYPQFLIILFTVFIFSYFLNGIITKSLLSPFKVKLKNLEAFGISVVTGFYNLITPFKGGMAARAVYFKTKYNFPYTDFLSTLAASYVLIFLVSSFFGALSTILIYKNHGIFSWAIFLIFISTFVFMLLIIIFAPNFNKVKNIWINHVIRVINGWHLIRKNKRAILIISTISFTQLVLSSLMLYIQFKMFGIQIDFISTTFLAAIGSLSLLIAITPANLGVSEAITVFSAHTIGISTSDSLAVALLGRVVSFLVLFILGPIFSYTLFKKKNNIFN